MQHVVRNPTSLLEQGDALLLVRSRSSATHCKGHSPPDENIADTTLEVTPAQIQGILGT